jgi:hypothetical protein
MAGYDRQGRNERQVPMLGMVDLKNNGYMLLFIVGSWEG